MDSQKVLPLESTIINDPDVERRLQQNANPDSQESSKKSEELFFDQHFTPRGAAAFFVLLIMLGMIIWFGIYFLMLSRV